VLPHLSAEMMQLFLDEFAAAHVTPGKHVVLVVDGASAHRAKSLRVPERLMLVPLPAYTPEFNPAERLWPLVREGVANRTQKSLASLEEAVCGRCRRIPVEQVTALTNYHWWPTT
jgi:transposase